MGPAQEQIREYPASQGQVKTPSTLPAMRPVIRSGTRLASSDVADWMQKRSE